MVQSGRGLRDGLRGLLLGILVGLSLFGVDGCRPNFHCGSSPGQRGGHADHDVTHDCQAAEMYG